MPRRWYTTDLSTNPPSYTISPTWDETISIDTTEVGVSDDPATGVSCTIVRLGDEVPIEATVSAVINGDNADIHIEAEAWGLELGLDYALRSDLTFGPETITRVTVLEVR
jgi:hypothetical protein